MGRKIITLLLCVVLFGAVCTTAHAETFTVYEGGNLSSTYTQYFKDILSGSKLTDKYVAFRSGQYDYKMIVGDLEYNSSKFTSSATCKVYTFSTGSSGYNNTYTYNVSEVGSVSLSVDDEIIYSNLGDYPELIDRGAKFEILNTMLLCTFMLLVITSRFFRLR